jgi:hypothetical protein
MLTNRPLASTTFVAGPQDDLATPDVYEIQSDAVINDLPVPSAIADVSDITSELRGGNAMLANLPTLDSIGGSASAVKSATSGGFLDTVKSYASSMSKAVGGVSGIKALASMSGPSLLARLSSGSLSGIPGLNGAGLTSVATALRNNAMPEEVKRLFNTPIPSVMGTYGQVGTNMVRLPNNSVNQSFQMGSLINNVMGTNNTNIVDKDGTARLIAGLSMGGMSCGMNNSFSSLSTLAGNDQQIILAAANAATRYASGTGNIGGLKDVVTTVGAPALRSVGKSLGKNLSTGYRPSDTAPISNATRLADFTDINDTLDAIDPGWMREDRMKVDVATHLPVVDFPVTDISLIQEGSADFRTTMVKGAINSTDPEKKWLAVGGMFASTSPEAELSRAFPTTVTSIGTQTTNSNLTFTPMQISALDVDTILQ